MTIPYTQLSEEIVERLANGEGPDEIEVGGLLFLFNIKATERYEMAYTGVEFDGRCEGYLRRLLYIDKVDCLGIFDADNNSLDCTFDTRNLNLNYSDDDVSITY